MGDGFLLQLDQEDIKNLHGSIMDLEHADLPSYSNVYRFLIPFLKYLLVKSGECCD
jgi:hypothetical protein